MDKDVLSDLFQRYFLSCRRLSSLPWKELQELLQSEPSFVLTILQKTFFHPLCQKYPPALRYRRLFLSELIKKHESTGADPPDVLYDAFADVLNTDEDTMCHKTYFLPSGETVTLSENVAFVSEGTTGLVTWEAALTLAEWSIAHMDIFKNRTILELGSGVGLTGIAVCKSCIPKKYVFSDCHHRVLKQLTENICLNGFQLSEEQKSQSKEQFLSDTEHGKSADNVKISVIDLHWESVTEKQFLHIQTDVDVVIASDVIYDPEIIISLSKFLNKLFMCMKNGRVLEVFIASTIRNPETYSFFKTSLDEHGLSWEVVLGHEKTSLSQDSNYCVEILKITSVVK
ncbi:protein-lysine N-methyltransferase EEF2KMT isoform X1 [Pelobates fuscus]|uniref:protein-lysine N-methyltransferase EEF2KMT isoform X1 n=1 Tax=Pelobates fuscus TaxID=191477 RepID=UPI002FE4CF48